MRPLPVMFVWRQVDIADDDGVLQRRFVMDPLPRYANITKRQFAQNEEYPLVILEERSRKSHSGYFASVHDGFQNLPENISARFPSENHLRKWCLCECGFFDEKEFDCDTEMNARRLGLFIRTEDEYARISIHGTKVIVRRAKSQSIAAMGKDEFQASKTAVLELLEHMIGVRLGTLKKESGRNA